MIERFNFFDVYGYLIPGIVLVLGVGLPYLTSGNVALPAGEWSLLIVGVLVAYLIGHVLQTVATTAIPSSKNLARERWRYPSAVMVGPDDSSLTEAMKKRIGICVKSWFDIDIDVEKKGDDHLGNLRQDAFELARRIVVKSGNYAEQFQGLYNMMRGITAALWLVAAYTLGWSIAFWRDPITWVIGEIVLVASILVFGALSVRHFSNIEALKRLSLSRITLAVLAIGFLALGYLSGFEMFPDATVLRYVVLVALYLGISLRTWSSCEHFAKEFAKSVWVQMAAGPTHRPSD